MNSSIFVSCLRFNCKDDEYVNRNVMVKVSKIH